jgi:stage II sporulation protein P
MKKSKRGFPVLICILVLLFIIMSVSKNGNGAEYNAALPAAKAADAQEMDIRINNGEPEKEITILLDDGEDDTVTGPVEDADDETSVSVGAAIQEEKIQNPILVLFDTLMAGASTVQANQGGTISIIIDENEHSDTDVSDEITIDVQDYPITKYENPTVLIYHTHTREAYTPEYAGQYAACGTFRTDDERYSVCAVGQKLADQLSGQYGFTVIHDTTMNETTPFAKSYDKSLETVLKDIKENPNIDVFIDVHRDSIGDAAYAQSQVIEKDGKRYAKVMFVVGRGDDYKGAEAPDWQSNYALAQAITEKINAIMPGLAKAPMVKTKRYNQHLSDKCMLIEVGYDANSITEAENSAGIVSKALSEVLSK